jgi:anti-anti-sigma regulatory factor
MKRVLVFPCGSEIGLEVQRALAESRHFEVIGASSVPDHGRFVYKNYVGDVPDVDSDQFVPRMNELVVSRGIDYIVPAHDSVVLKLARNQESLRAVAVTSDVRTCEVCRSKALTYRVLEGIVPTPRSYHGGDFPVFPVFLKPDVGQGSRGTVKALSQEEIEFHVRRDPTLLRLEYLPGAEYTVDCFTDRHGRLLFSGARLRRRIQGGISVNSAEVRDPRFGEIAERINATLPLRGAWFFQVKERATGELVLLEIAPRIAGTMALFRVDGVNFVQLSLFDRMGMPVTVLRNNLPVEIDRALAARFRLGHQYSRVYVDLDDTLIIDGRVNTALIAFLYQARNQGKRITLLSRHRRDLRQTLHAAALSEDLFDEVQLIGDTASKSAYIVGTDAIFIDDSFAERQEVSHARGIPVFSLDAVEALVA